MGSPIFSKIEICSSSSGTSFWRYCNVEHVDEVRIAVSLIFLELEHFEDQDMRLSWEMFSTDLRMRSDWGTYITIATWVGTESGGCEVILHIHTKQGNSPFKATNEHPEGENEHPLNGQRVRPSVDDNFLSKAQLSTMNTEPPFRQVWVYPETDL